MFGIGIPEIIVLAIIAVLTATAIGVPIYLRSHFSIKKWLGITLSIILVPWGQLYLKGASIFIVLLLIFAMLSNILIGNFLLAILVSPFLMWYRFNKLLKLKNQKLPD